MSSTADALLTTETVINQYIYPILAAFGIIGHVFNIIVFSGPNLRSYSCYTYFVAAAISAIINLSFALVPMIDGSLNSQEFYLKSSTFCKTRKYITQVTGMFCRWTLVMACVDRCFLGSQHRCFRSFSSVHCARLISLVMLIVLMLFSLHIPINATTLTLEGVDMGCSFTTLNASIYNDIYILIVGCVFVPVLAIVCRLIFLHRLNPALGQTQIQADPKQVQVSMMVAGKVLFFLSLNWPDFFFSFYMAITRSMTGKSVERIAIEGFFGIFSELLGFIFLSALFYFNTTAAMIFRSEFIFILERIFGCSTRIEQIAPIESNARNGDIRVNVIEQNKV